MSCSPSRQRKSRINLGAINLTCNIDTCTCILGGLCSPLLRWKFWTPLDLVGGYLRDPGACTVGIQLWCALHHCLLIHAGHTQYTYHTEHTRIIIYTCKWGKKSATRVPKFPFNYALCLSTQWTLCSWRSCKNGHQRWCQKNLPNVIPKGPLQLQTHLIWTLIWSVADETA